MVGDAKLDLARCASHFDHDRLAASAGVFDCVVAAFHQGNFAIGRIGWAAAVAGQKGSQCGCRRLNLGEIATQAQLEETRAGPRFRV